MRRKEYLLRKDMPYGVRWYANGAVELFNRDYEVVLRKGPEPEGEPVDQSFYFTDRDPPWRNRKTRIRCEAVLREWGGV